MAKNYKVLHMGVGLFGQNDVVTDADLRITNDDAGKRALQRLFDLGAIEETSEDRYVAGEHPGDPEQSRGYPLGGMRQAQADIGIVTTEADVPVEEARKAARQAAKG
jgi:hypothetical protein